MADNYVSEKSSEVLGDDLYEKTCQFLIGKVQRKNTKLNIYEDFVECQFLIGKVQHKKFRFKILINNEVEGEIIMQFYGILCQFLIGKVQHIDYVFRKAQRQLELCQFLIGKVQRDFRITTALDVSREEWCQFLIGKVQRRFGMYPYYELDVSIPNRQGTTINNEVEGEKNENFWSVNMCQFLIGKVQLST